MRILVVDDEPGLRQAVSRILVAEGHETFTASHGEEALAVLDANDADVVLCDLRMPKMNGLEFIDAHAARRGRALVIAMSAYGDADTAIAAIQRGACDYIQKPFRAEEVLLCVRKAAEREQLRSRVRRLEAELEALRGVEMVGQSEGLRAVVALARKVARHSSTVLITGESGTGKELLARLIHRSSPRAHEAFVMVNCGGIPDTLLESDLFGHVKGAFTGALSDKRGLFEEAGNGTLFLDEIGELPLALQVKLLRVLQEGEVRRLGSIDTRVVDVRVVAATNRDLAADASAGRFREDLYYQVNVVGLRLPPLRERREDIPSLALHFVHRHGAQLGLDGAVIEPEALRLLMEHDWPGNVRELGNVIERALALSGDGAIRAEQLADLVHRSLRTRELTSAEGDLSVKRRTEELERRLIRRALERTRGNRTRAARLLDLSHRALLYKIRDYGLGD